MAFLGLAQQCQGEFRLEERFSAGKGESSAGAGVEEGVLFHVVDNVLYPAFAAVKKHGICRAGAYARRASDAEVVIFMNALGVETQCMLRTCPHAALAAYAQGIVPRDVGIGLL